MKDMVDFLTANKLALSTNKARRMLWTGLVKVNGRLATQLASLPNVGDEISIGKKRFTVTENNIAIPKEQSDGTV